MESSKLIKRILISEGYIDRNKSKNYKVKVSHKTSRILDDFLFDNEYDYDGDRVTEFRIRISFYDDYYKNYCSSQFSFNLYLIFSIKDSINY